jgi:intracellular multiplication protein IcmD
MNNLLKKIVLWGSICWLSNAMASPQDLADIARNVQGSLSAFANLMITIAYLAGVGFTISAIFKFKQHKDNPTQVPVGTPFALLGIGIILMFLPGIFKPAARTIFGSDGADQANAMEGTMVTQAVLDAGRRNF